MATQERNTHTISKYVQVVCELKLYTGGRFVVPATQTPAQCNSRSRDASTGPGRCAVGAVNIQSQKKDQQKVCLREGSFSLSEGVFMQCQNQKTKKNKKHLFCLGLFTHLLALLQGKDTCTSKHARNDALQSSIKDSSTKI